MTPFDLANECVRLEVAELLSSYSQVFDDEVGQRIATPTDDHPADALQSFRTKYSSQHANLDLIVELLEFIDSHSASGAVLVFLPAYNDVTELRDKVLTSDIQSRVHVHMLHSQILYADYKKMLLPADAGKRKVIVSTDMAETSVPFYDVICVIVCGLVRDRENDVVVRSNCKTHWITKVGCFLIVF